MEVDERGHPVGQDHQGRFFFRLLNRQRQRQDKDKDKTDFGLCKEDIQWGKTTKVALYFLFLN